MIDECYIYWNISSFTLKNKTLQVEGTFALRVLILYLQKQMPFLTFHFRRAGRKEEEKATTYVKNMAQGI